MKLVWVKPDCECGDQHFFVTYFVSSTLLFEILKSTKQNSLFHILVVFFTLERDWIERIDIEAAHGCVERQWTITWVNVMELH